MPSWHSSTSPTTPNTPARSSTSGSRTQTQNKIKDLLPQGTLTELTRLVLTNAIYFKGDWTQPFRKEATHEEDFHVTRDKTTRVQLMHQKHDFRFGAQDGVKVIDLPYGGQKDLSSIVLLPDAIDGLPALEQKLSLKGLTQWLGTLRSPEGRRLPAPVQAHVPVLTEQGPSGHGHAAGV